VSDEEINRYVRHHHHDSVIHRHKPEVKEAVKSHPEVQRYLEWKDRFQVSPVCAEWDANLPASSLIRPCKQRFVCHCHGSQEAHPDAGVAFAGKIPHDWIHNMAQHNSKTEPKVEL
jgi:hypothetical protein